MQSRDEILAERFMTDIEVVRSITDAAISVTVPLIALVKLLVDNGVLDQNKLDEYLDFYLDPSKFDAVSAQLLKPAWESFRVQIRG